MFALIHIDRAHFSPFAPHGAMSVITTSGLLFVAYLGFNVVCSMAPEVQAPARTIPRAIVLSMGNVAAIAAMTVINVAAFHAPRKAPEETRAGMRLPLGPVLPALGALAALSQLAFISLVPVIIGLALLAAGSLV